MVVLHLARWNLARAAAVDDLDVLAAGQALRDPAGIHRDVATTVSGISGRSPAFARRRKPVKGTTRVLDCTASARFQSSQDLIHFYLDRDPDGEEYIGYVAVMTF